HRIQQRTTQLHDRLDCYRITTGAADNLGPLPATGSCATPPKQRFDEQTTNQNDTHDHPADPEPPDDGDSSHTPRPPGGNAEEPHRRAAAPPQLPRTSKTTAPLDREPYRPRPTTTTPHSRRPTPHRPMTATATTPHGPLQGTPRNRIDDRQRHRSSHGRRKPPHHSTESPTAPVPRLRNRRRAGLPGHRRSRT